MGKFDVGYLVLVEYQGYSLEIYTFVAFAI